MFTPQRKGWSGWSLSPRAGDGQDNGSALANPRSGSRVILGKGKGVATGESALPAPPRFSLGENGGGGTEGSGDVEVWKRFREAGLLDEAALQKKDREVLVMRITELEKELHDYQYNMGLLLIEKKEWSSIYEEIRQRLSEAEEIIKHEQAAHLIAISELEEREANSRKAFGIEKQTVTDLKKALDEMYHEIAQVKYTSDKKLSEAHALEARIEEKNLEIDEKLHSADAKLAEASRKSSEIDRKLEDVEARERKLQREYWSLNTERKAHEKNVAERRAHLENWEKQLQEGQKRLVEERRLLNDREDRANETDRVLKKKQEELEETRRVIEDTKNSMKNKEDEIIVRLRASADKEKDADVKIKNLETKERDLLAIEEKLNAREREEIQKLVDEHNSILDAKRQEFELEMEKKRKSFDEEVRSKLDEVDKEKNEITRKEEEVIKREQALECKTEKLKNKEKDLETKSKTFKNWEESIESDKKKLAENKQQLMNDSQKLDVSRSQLESLRAAIQAEEQKIIQEKENIKITQEEREEHLKLQSQLKREIEECRLLKESLVKESDALRAEREKFEREWEVLDWKRMALEEEVKKVNDEKERFEKWRHNEHERLENEGRQARADIQRELDDLRLKKEAFENMMAHERLEACEEVKRKLADIDREQNLRKHDLNVSMLRKQEDMEKKLQERENDFDRRREIEMDRINSLNNLDESKIRTVKVEQDRLEREKIELSIHRKKLEADQDEIRNDIDKLRMLSRNLKDQREEFIKERDRFLVVAEQCKTCHNCGFSVNRELEMIGLQPSRGIKDAGDVLLPSLADGFLEEHMQGKQIVISPQAAGSQSVNSGGRMSWLQKCSRLFKFSPGKNVGPSTVGQTIPFGEQLDMAASEDNPHNRVADDSFDNHRAQSDSGAWENVDSERLYKAGDKPEPSLGVADNSIDIVRIQSVYDDRANEGEPVIPSIEEQNEMEGSSLPPESNSQPQPSKQRRRQPSRRCRPKAIKRTRSVREVVEDAKAFLGETSAMKIDGEPNGDAKDFQNIHEESRGASVHADEVATNARQKRRRPQASGMTTSEIEAEDSEARSESVSVGGRRKRRHTSAPEIQPPGDKPYNLRRSTVAAKTAAAQAASYQKGPKEGSHEVLKGGHDADGTSKLEDAVSPSSGFVEENCEAAHMLQKATGGSVMEVHEISSQKLVRFETEEDCDESDDNIVARSVELSEGNVEDGDEVDGAATMSLRTTPSDGSDGSEDDNDEDDSEKHNVSIGKKFWTFFTT